MAAVTGRPPGTHRLRRTEDGTSILDLELARRGKQLQDLINAGVGRMTLRRLRYTETYKRGTSTTLANAYKIAAALDPEQTEAMVERLSERVEAAGTMGDTGRR